MEINLWANVRRIDMGQYCYMRLTSDNQIKQQSKWIRILVDPIASSLKMKTCFRYHKGQQSGISR